MTERSLNKGKFNTRDWARANPVWKFALAHLMVIYVAAIAIYVMIGLFVGQSIITPVILVMTAIMIAPFSIAHAAFFKNLWSDNPPRVLRSLRRNHPCLCGSGKKYKHCHYMEDSKKAAREAADRPYRNIQKQFEGKIPDDV